MSEKPAKSKIFAELVADRKELVELLKDLTEQEWATPSLCAGWQVRDVIAHLISPQADMGLIFKTTLLTGGNYHKGEEAVIDKYRKFSLPTLLSTMVANIQPRGAFTNLLPMIILHDNWVHQQDIRWVLGSNRQRKHNTERLKMLLEFHRAGLQKKLDKDQGIAKKVKFSVPEFGWSVGQGAEVSGDAASIIMAIDRRPTALERLQGPGVAILRESMQK